MGVARTGPVASVSGKESNCAARASHTHLVPAMYMVESFLHEHTCLFRSAEGLYPHMSDNDERHGKT